MKPSESCLEVCDCGKHQANLEDLFTIPNSKYVYSNNVLEYNNKYKEEFSELLDDLLAEQQEQC